MAKKQTFTLTLTAEQLILLDSGVTLVRAQAEKEIKDAARWCDSAFARDQARSSGSQYFQADNLRDMIRPLLCSIRDQDLEKVDLPNLRQLHEANPRLWPSGGVFGPVYVEPVDGADD